MKKSLIAVVLLLIIALGLYFIFRPQQVPTEVSTINYTFRVSDKVTINLDVDKVNFGGGPVGASLQRRMNISSPYDALVRIDSTGPGKLRVNKNDFILLENTPTEVEFSVLLTSDLTQGDYEGTIFVYFYD